MSHPLPVVPAPCACTHGVVFHNLSTNRQNRTACSVSEGRKAVPCGCRRYEAEAGRG